MADIALQLIVFGDEVSRDPERVFNIASQAGYAALEFGYNPNSQNAETIRKALERTGLAVAGIHTGYELLRDAPCAVADYAAAVGAPNVIVSGVEVRASGEQAYLQAAEMFNRVGEYLCGLGLTLAYHNHSFEFALVGGKPGILWLYETTDSQIVKLCIDTYWVLHGGEDPLEWLHLYGNRTAVLHLKDMSPPPERTFIEIGRGIIDFRSVLREAEVLGIPWWVVEQDRTTFLPEESVVLSREGLRRLGY